MKLLSNFLISFLSIIVFAMPIFAANWKEIAPKGILMLTVINICKIHYIQIDMLFGKNI